jgi:hypothetical protein
MQSQLLPRLVWIASGGRSGEKQALANTQFCCEVVCRLFALDNISKLNSFTAMSGILLPMNSKAA